jgi:hypothetical protein
MHFAHDKLATIARALGKAAYTAAVWQIGNPTALEHVAICICAQTLTLPVSHLPFALIPTAIFVFALPISMSPIIFPVPHI